MSVNKVNADGSLTRIAGGTLYADMAIGTIVPFGGSKEPSGFLFCQGQAVSRTTYEELFKVIGTAFGSGDGSTTFNLPDLRETVPVGSGTRASGVESHDTYDVGEFKDDQFQTHAHGAFYSMPSPAAGGRTFLTADGTGTANTSVGRFGTTTHGKQLGVNYIIKAVQSAIPIDIANAVDDKLSDLESEVTELQENEYERFLLIPKTVGE